MKLTLSITEKRVVFEDTSNNRLNVIEDPVRLELWDGNQDSDSVWVRAQYNQIQESDKKTKCTAIIEDDQIGKAVLTDCYYLEANDKVRLDRKLVIEKAGSMKGVRLWLLSEIFPTEVPKFQDFRYFAPPAIFDKNDLDEDGVEDYFHTRSLIYREDRINFPKFVCYNEKNNTSITLGRAILPAFDSLPERKNKETKFLQKTDIGSLGVWNDTERQLELRGAYPFYEAGGCIGLYVNKNVPFGAFWPLENGEELTVSYFFDVQKHEGFNAACWDSIRRTMQENDIQAPPLPDTPETIARYRLESLERYYVEKDADEDPNAPAGYVLNCHPQDGKQLADIIQYGFTGQNILNAYNVLRFGYEHNIQQYKEHAIRIADFFADTIHIKDVGMFYNQYNVDAKRMGFWWTGLLLPLEYAQGDELGRLMGDLYDYRKDIIEKLATIKGGYIRCMNEDARALLKLYRYELDKGNDHPNWIAAVRNYCDFMVSVQERDGSWFRAYDLDGNPITDPILWFGTTIYEKKSSTGTTISLLVEMHDFTGDKKYLESAQRAGDFVKEYIIDRVRFNGGVHDSMYAKGQLIDNESIMYPMFGMLSLYRATKKQKFLDGAITAAHFNAAWVCLWDIPLPEDSTLAKYGFRTTGIGACDTCGAGYTHPFQLMTVAEIAEIAILAKDRELFEAARLYWHGCSQTVSLPQNDWGLAHYGLQEEGFLVSWFAVDDPMFADDTGFGRRWKGEGNKTCFPWIQAVALNGYWSLIDTFGTADFDDICKKHF